MALDDSIRLVRRMENQQDDYGSKVGGLKMNKPIQYQVGPLTMSHVFEYAKLQNLSDMQAVLDAMEAALERKNDHIRMIAREAKEPS